jgi:hypothetical protein
MALEFALLFQALGLSAAHSASSGQYLKWMQSVYLALAPHYGAPNQSSKSARMPEADDTSFIIDVAQPFHDALVNHDVLVSAAERTASPATLPRARRTSPAPAPGPPPGPSPASHPAPSHQPPVFKPTPINTRRSAIRDANGELIATAVILYGLDKWGIPHCGQHLPEAALRALLGLLWGDEEDDYAIYKLSILDRGTITFVTINGRVGLVITFPTVADVKRFLHGKGAVLQGLPVSLDPYAPGAPRDAPRPHKTRDGARAQAQVQALLASLPANPPAPTPSPEDAEVTAATSLTAPAGNEALPAEPGKRPSEDPLPEDRARSRSRTGSSPKTGVDGLPMELAPDESAAGGGGAPTSA